MYGNDRKRFCADCKLNVYNLSGMTRREAEDLLARSEGRLCVRFYRRADGSVITADCPKGLARVKERLSAAAAAVFSVLAGLFGGLGVMSLIGTETPVPQVGKIGTVPTETRPYVMGAMAIPRNEFDKDGVARLKPIEPSTRVR
jgi:hypothetical protein